MNKLLITLLSFLILAFSSRANATSAEMAELAPCIVKTHCVLVNWKVNDVQKSFLSAIKTLKDTPRTKIVESSDSYIHAEATTKWMHYVDDLEIKAIPEKKALQIRSESRVGIGDMGINQKRVDLLTSQLINSQAS